MYISLSNIKEHAVAKKNKDEEEIPSPEEFREFLKNLVKVSEERGVSPEELLMQYKEYAEEHGEFEDEDFFGEDEELTEAEMLVEEAYDTDIPEEKIRLASEALELEPENLLAMYIMADEVPDPMAALEWAITAEEVAATFLEDDFYEKHYGEFSAFPEGVLYLEAANRLANKLTVVGKYSESIELLEELMQLDILDNMRIRDFLLPVYAVTRKFNAYERLQLEFDDEPSVATAFNHVLYTAMKYGTGLKANHALKKAIEQYGNIFDMLNSEIALDALEEDPGDVAEKMSYLMDTVHLWFLNPKIVEWLSSTVVDTEELFKDFED